MQTTTKLNDNTYIVNARQIPQVPNNSLNYIEASKELARACLLSELTKGQVDDLNIVPAIKEKVVQIIKSALNQAYSNGCVEALERYVK